MFQIVEQCFCVFLCRRILSQSGLACRQIGAHALKFFLKPGAFLLCLVTKFFCLFYLILIRHAG